LPHCNQAQPRWRDTSGESPRIQNDSGPAQGHLAARRDSVRVGRLACLRMARWPAPRPKGRSNAGTCGSARRSGSRWGWEDDRSAWSAWSTIC